MQATSPTAQASFPEDEFRRHLVAAREVLLRHLRACTPAAARGWLDLEDLWQEICVTALVVRPRFDWQGRGAFVRWLKVVAERLILRAMRQRRQNRSGHASQYEALGELIHPELGPFAVAERTEQLARTFTALRLLPDDQQEVLVLHLLQGLDHRAVAHRLGRLPEAVRKSRYRALRALRRYLGA